MTIVTTLGVGEGTAAITGLGAGRDPGDMNARAPAWRSGRVRVRSFAWGPR